MMIFGELKSGHENMEDRLLNCSSVKETQTHSQSDQSGHRFHAEVWARSVFHADPAPVSFIRNPDKKS